MGNETEFQTKNGQNWETIRDKKHNFPTKKQEKQEKIGTIFYTIRIVFNEKLENTRNTETRKTQYNMILRNAIRERSENSGKVENNIRKRKLCFFFIIKLKLF